MQIISANSKFETLFFSLDFFLETMRKNDSVIKSNCKRYELEILRGKKSELQIISANSKFETLN